LGKKKKNPEKMNKDNELMIRALDVAMEGIQKGGGPFGAVITRNEEIIAEAYNKVVSANDPTAHAEILAIRKACELTGSHDISDCTLYASCEPCPMCMGAIYWSGIKRVVYASDRKDATRAGFGDDLSYEEIIKNPDQRKISFCKIQEVDGSEVFKMWNRYENKILY
jgi:tRNA(Arg) A34 adenosine deaminase TadA